ncbi:SusC/RagA family TonB-linked outer membrane protein [Ferruginibacter albus]|uniref:SusC/RagA family TonB-linked outer membrane protein n=1 Tax=Ferruginibacter albus TaxID=2875540 RepID=UPI001CC61A82|nr:TonB-dependent receptor [Ferruginibacter albus]UAY51563.1 TonB-dependent receptor [Ferruginibacter albus]
MKSFFTDFKIKLAKRILFVIVLMPVKGLAQIDTIHEHAVSGKVTSEAGLALSNVSIQIQGTSKGTTTNATGEFAIIASDSDVLVFSSVGYKTQMVTVAGQTGINVTLATSAEELTQVIVVGYGTQRKRDVTGATSTVNGSDLVKQIVNTPTQALQGKATGVQIIASSSPGIAPQIRIRGTGTALGGTHALYVVDGILTDDITNINTADITDITILKDASATSIYGSRGANGVVIITTKKGASGKMVINYSDNIGVSQAANLVRMANTAEYDNYYQASTGQIPISTPYSTDWYNTILRNAWQQTHNLSISGGNDKAVYFFSAGYIDQDGIVINNNYKRFTLRSNEEFKVTNAIKFGIQASYSNGVNQNGFNNINLDSLGNAGSVLNDAYRAAPIIANIENGKYGNTSAYQNVGNPLLDLNDNNIKAISNRLQGAAYVEIKPFQWVTYRSSIGADWYSNANRAYNYQFNSDTTTFLIAGGNQYNNRSSLNIKNSNTLHWVWDNLLTFTKRIQKNDITLLIGTTAEKFQYSFISSSRKDVPADPNLWYIGVGDANSSQNDGNGDAWSRASYFGRINYAYDNKYLLTASIRSDGSSRLPSQNRYRTYPSVGLGWVISKEDFMRDQKIFDYLKLRGSWGRVGNDQIETGAFTTTVAQNLGYPFGGIADNATNGSRITQFKDPNITWEETEEYDAALEFAFFNSKLTGEINYYNKNVLNALINKFILATIYDENSLVLTNAATIQNKGWEFSLNWKDKVSKNVSYSIGGNITFNTNTVTSLNGGVPTYGGDIGANQGLVTLTDVGQPVGSFYVLQVLGVFNTDADVNNYVDKNGNKIQPTANPGDFKYLDKNGDGKIDDNDRVFAGSYQPVAYYGINGSVTYKNWDFSFDIYGNAGNKVYNGKRAVRVYGTDNVEADLAYNRWTPTNQSQTQPAANTGNLLASTYFVESGSFARLNNVTIGFTLPEKTLQRIKISGLRIFASVQNIYTLKAYSGFTAELPGEPTDSGIELDAYPTTRSMVVGVNVSL